MFQNIAVTTDFTAASRLPFPAAASLARKFGARLEVLHLVQSPQVFTPWQITPERPEDARRRAAERVERLRSLIADEPCFQGLGARPAAILGESAEAIAEHLRKEKIDLVVIATHGYSGVRLFPLGSFAAQVIQFAGCPVLIYRAMESSREPRPELAPRRILVPYDFSRPSGASLAVARELARTFECAVRLLSVVKPELLIYGDSLLTEEAVAAKSEELRVETQARLVSLIDRDWRGVQAEARSRVGHPALEILRESAEHQPDLIIMASRGLSVVERLPLGSVAERVIHGAGCPVLVVK